jgi:hypothetical protein
MSLRPLNYLFIFEFMLSHLDFGVILKLALDGLFQDVSYSGRLSDQ